MQVSKMFTDQNISLKEFGCAAIHTAAFALCELHFGVIIDEALLLAALHNAPM